MERIDIGEIPLEMLVQGDGPPLLFLHGGDYVGAEPAVPRPSGAAVPGRRAAPSRLWHQPAPRLDAQRRRHRLSPSRPDRAAGARRRDRGRVVVRRLGGDGDGDPLGGAARAAGADRLARGQVRRRATKRTSPMSTRCPPTRWCAAPSPTPPTAPDYDTTERGASRGGRARPRGGGALRLAALYAQPGLAHWLHRIKIPTLVLWGESDGIAAPPMARSSAQAMPGARLSTDRRRRPLPADRAAGTRSPSAIETFCARRTLAMMHTSGTSARWPITRPGRISSDSYRVIIPSRLYDPKIGADLYHRYLDEWALCDELGINIMTNEHHATATCADSVCTIPMAILARETKKVRLLALGMPIANRNEPDPRRRGIFDARRDLARAHRDGVRQGRAVRDFAGQHQPGRSDGAVLGGARPDPQGDDLA